MQMFARNLGVKVIRVDAEALPGALAGVADPEAKRKIIGRLFIEVFDEEARKRGRRLPRPGHHLPGRDRVRRQQDRQGACHQVAPQRRRPARAT
jgi:hypothetical protein